MDELLELKLPPAQLSLLIRTLRMGALPPLLDGESPIELMRSAVDLHDRARSVFKAWHDAGDQPPSAAPPGASGPAKEG